MRRRRKSQRWEEFCGWLTQLGADVLPPTNEWERARWKANGITSVLYENKKSSLSFSGEAEAAYCAWQTGDRYEVDKTKRRKLTPKVAALVERDGPNCWYCDKPMTETTTTIEHLVPVNCGGPNHTANLVLAHGDCNKLAGSKPVAEKVKLRDELRGRP